MINMTDISKSVGTVAGAAITIGVTSAMLNYASRKMPKKRKSKKKRRGY